MRSSHSKYLFICLFVCVHTCAILPLVLLISNASKGRTQENKILILWWTSPQAYYKVRADHAQGPQHMFGLWFAFSFVLDPPLCDGFSKIPSTLWNIIHLLPIHSNFFGPSGFLGLVLWIEVGPSPASWPIAQSIIFHVEGPQALRASPPCRVKGTMHTPLTRPWRKTCPTPLHKCGLDCQGSSNFPFHSLSLRVSIALTAPTVQVLFGLIHLRFWFMA